METRRCNMACIFLHLFINVFLMILGISLLGLGLAEESTQLTALLTAESKIGMLAVVIGVILIVITTVNCCFAIDGSYVFYYIYAGILVLLFIAMIGLFFAYGAKIGTKVNNDIRSSMFDMMKYYPDGSDKTEMDFIQQTFECCGVDSFTDWYNVTGNPTVPASCCIQVGCDPSLLDNIHQEACVSNIMKTVDSEFAKMSAIAITVTIFLPIQVILVIIMIRYVNSNAV